MFVAVVVVIINKVKLIPWAHIVTCQHNNWEILQLFGWCVLSLSWVASGILLSHIAEHTSVTRNESTKKILVVSYVQLNAMTTSSSIQDEKSIIIQRNDMQKYSELLGTK